MNTEQLKKGVIALRVSSTKQYQSGDSPEEQRQAAEQRARDLSIEVLDFQEFAESASQRVEFHDQPVKKAIDWTREKHPQAKFLVLKNIDRFTRAGGGVYRQLKDYAASYGIQIVDAQEVISNRVINTLEHLGVKNSDKYDWALENPSEMNEVIEAEKARAEWKKIIQRLIGAQMNYTLLGYSCHPAPFGYVAEKAETDHGMRYIWYPHPEESQWIITAYQLLAEGVKKDEEIVEVINAMGYRSRTKKKRDKKGNRIGEKGGKKLTVKQLKKMIAYTNFAGVNSEKWLEGQFRKYRFPGLVSIELFNKANNGKVVILEEPNGVNITILKNQPPDWQLKKNKKNPNYPFKEYILCPFCRRPFKASGSTGKSKKKFPAYHCYKKHDHYFRKPRKEVHDLIQELVGHVEFSDEFITDFRRILLEEWEIKRQVLGDQSTSMSLSVADLREQRQMVVNKIPLLSEISVIREMEKKVKEFDSLLAQTELQIKKITASELDVQKVIDRSHYFMEHLEELILGDEDPLVNGSMFSLLFAKPPTYTELEDGTLELAPLFKLNEAYKQGKDLKVSPPGLEPGTHSLKGCRSNRLSYGPIQNRNYTSHSGTREENKNEPRKFSLAKTPTFAHTDFT